MLKRDWCMKKIVCAIHQPNFFPWLGYFDKIKRSDIFVFLDAVDYPRNGSSGMGCMTNRVQINMKGKPSWIGCPIQRASSNQAINNTRICYTIDWRRKIHETLRHNYSRRIGQKKALELISPLINFDADIVSEYNINAICAISQALGYKCKFVKQSELNVDGKGTDLLINITKAVGAGVYLCGGGAGGYQNDSLFNLSSIELVYQNYQHEIYGDPRRFVKGLSIIDYLMESEW